MRTTLFCLFFLLVSGHILHAQQFQWVKGGGEPWANSTGSTWEDESVFYNMCTDPNGNVYAVSYVGPSGLPLTADTFYRATGSYGYAGGNTNILITSYNCAGQMRWAKLIGSEDQSGIYGITADSLGHIYLAGDFRHTETVPSPIPLYIGYDTIITGVNNETAGIIQFDTTGHFNWIRFTGNNTSASKLGVLSGGMSASGNYQAVTIDGANNVHFIEGLGAGVPLTASFTTLHRGTYDLTYDVSGNLISYPRLDLDSQWFIHGAVIDPATNKLYTYGEVNQSMAPGIVDTFFAAAFDASRNRLWQYFSGHGDDDGFTGITIDQNKHLLFSGAAQTTSLSVHTIFSFNSDSLVSINTSTMSVILKTDTNGHVDWIKGFYGSSGVNNFESITLLPNNKIAALGTMTGKVVNGYDSIVTYTGEGWNPFFVIVDSASDLQTIQQIHGDGFYDGGYAITSDKTGNVYIGGKVANTIWAGSLSPYVTHGGNSDFYVMKYGVGCSCTTPPMASYNETGSHTVNFTYTGTATGLDSVVWNFGDGDTVHALNPVHTYTAPGIYHACATGYNDCGSDIYCTDINLPCFSAPVASYTDTGTHIIGFTYTGATTGLDSVRWKFGDGGTDTGRTIIHAYTAIGTYTVCALAYNPCGADTTCNTVTVPCLSAPTASYTDTGTHTIGFTYTGTTTGVDSIIWHFGDGDTAHGPSRIHTYTSTGTFTACVTAYSQCGSNTSCNTVSVPCLSAPVVSYTDTGTYVVGFTYTGSMGSLDSVAWDYGDGGSDTGITSHHTYTAVGTYTVCATAYTPCGNTTGCHTVTVPCISAPVASFTDTGNHVVGFVYTGTTIAIDSVTWTFGDGGTATGNGPFHTYAATGTYTVCATAHTPCGSNTSCNTVTVTCVGSPTASYTDTGVHVIGFTYTGTTVNLDSVVWNYGDGNSDTGLTAIHSYTVPGTYTVCATVYTGCGTDTHCATVNVPCVIPPTAAFTDTGSHTFGFTYTGTTAGIDSVVWSFGDGNSATGNTTLHTYATADTYQVCVTAYTPCGSDSVCQEVIMPPLGIASVSNTDVKVYPNPTMNELIVTGITQNTAYRLLNVTGVCLQHGTLYAGMNTLSIQDYAPGIYVLEMTGTDGVRVIVRVVKE